MHRRDILKAGLAGLVLMTGVARAQPAEEAAVAAAVEALSRAMIAVDTAQLGALSSDALSYGHSAGRIETKAQFIANLVARNSAFRSINLTDQTISVSGSEAIVRHTFTGETVNPAGAVSPVRIGVLQVWRKEGATWRLLARQAFRI